jgi:hypothetical protein
MKLGHFITFCNRYETYWFSHIDNDLYFTDLCIGNSGSQQNAPCKT